MAKVGVRHLGRDRQNVSKPKPARAAAPARGATADNCGARRGPFERTLAANPSTPRTHISPSLKIRETHRNTHNFQCERATTVIDQMMTTGCAT